MCATIQLNTFPASEPLASMAKTSDANENPRNRPHNYSYAATKKRMRNIPSVSSVSAAPLSLATVARPTFSFLGRGGLWTSHSFGRSTTQTAG